MGKKKSQTGANLKKINADRAAGKRPAPASDDDDEYLPPGEESGDASDGDAQVRRGDPNPLGTALGRA